MTLLSSRRFTVFRKVNIFISFSNNLYVWLLLHHINSNVFFIRKRERVKTHKHIIYDYTHVHTQQYERCKINYLWKEIKYQTVVEGFKTQDSNIGVLYFFILIIVFSCLYLQSFIQYVSLKYFKNHKISKNFSLTKIKTQKKTILPIYTFYTFYYARDENINSE